MTKRNEAIAILTGGGPAPGMNTVVGSVAKTFLQKGYSVIGLHKGFTGLFRERPPRRTSPSSKRTKFSTSRVRSCA